MSYFSEIASYTTYSGNEDDFHFNYNANSGGGQAFLGGRFYNENGQLISPEDLKGKIAVFRYVFRSKEGATIETILDSKKSQYEIKPRSKDSKSMKLSVEGKVSPSKVIASSLMLPSTCGVKMPNELQISILSADNYWLQSMWLTCDKALDGEKKVVFTIKDCIFAGGANKEGGDGTLRYFKLNFEARMAEIISLANIPDIFNKDISEVLKMFADIYLGLRRFDYEECFNATRAIMKLTVQQFPDAYSGITDPLPVLCEIAAQKFSELKNSRNNNVQSEGTKCIRYKTDYNCKYSRNRILFGAPGTGKSFTLNKEAKELIGADNEHDYERVTFHPDYSYANFVGTYKPTPDKDADGKDTITYKYVPGPFMRTYVKALKNSRTDNIKPYLLIIEEINRANVAAVFGDVFQLLDRGSDNVSEYPIETSEDMREYLKDELGGELEDYAKIRIPDNMFIWATMNSADQGVFPMDTAFKRRWEFTYLGIDDNDEELRGKWVKLAADESQQVEWNKLRKTINKFLSEKKINEDKQLGPYFIARNIVVPDGEDEDEINRDKFIRTFKNKVIMYLFEDAAKMRKDDLFSGCPEDKRRYSEICSEFDKNGVKIFHTDIQNEVLGGKKADADKNDV